MSRSNRRHLFGENEQALCTQNLSSTYHGFVRVLSKRHNVAWYSDYERNNACIGRCVEFHVVRVASAIAFPGIVSILRPNGDLRVPVARSAFRFRAACC